MPLTIPLLYVTSRADHFSTHFSCHVFMSVDTRTLSILASRCVTVATGMRDGTASSLPRDKRFKEGSFTGFTLKSLRGVPPLTVPVFHVDGRLDGRAARRCWQLCRESVDKFAVPVVCALSQYLPKLEPCLVRSTQVQQLVPWVPTRRQLESTMRLTDLQRSWESAIQSGIQSAHPLGQAGKLQEQDSLKI